VDCRLSIVDCGFEILDCGFETGDLRLWISQCQPCQGAILFEGCANDRFASFSVLAIGNKQDLLPISFEKKKSQRSPQRNFQGLRVFLTTKTRAACTGRTLVLNKNLRVR